MTIGRNLITFVSAIIVMVCMVVLFALSRDESAAVYDRVYNDLHALQTLDNQWSLEVVKVSANPQADFDSLAGFLPTIRSHKNELRRLLSRPDSLSREHKSALRSYLSMLDSKEERIERFKSGYAIVRNSERYLPEAARMAVTVAQSSNEFAIAEQVAARLGDLEAYLISPNEVEMQRLVLALRSLGESAVRSVLRVRETLDVFLAHATVLLNRKGPVMTLLADATRTITSDEADQLKAVFGELRKRHLTIKDKYEGGILLLAAVLFLLVLWAMRGRQNRERAASQPQELLEGEVVVTSGDGSTGGGVSGADLSFGGAEEAAALSSLAAQTDRLNARTIMDDISRTTQLLRALARKLNAVHDSNQRKLTDLNELLSEQLAAGTSSTSNKRLVSVAQSTLTAFQSEAASNMMEQLARGSARVNFAAKRFALGSGFNRTGLEDWIVINACIEAAVQITNLRERADVHLRLSEAPSILGLREEFVTIFVNVLRNAADALRDEPVIRIKSEVVVDTLVVTISDNGIGMDNETRNSAPKMFYTTKAQAFGTGLATVHALIGRMNGDVLLSSAPDKGTAVKLTLPLTNTDVPATGLSAIAQPRG